MLTAPWRHWRADVLKQVLAALALLGKSELGAYTARSLGRPALTASLPLAHTAWHFVGAV